MMSIMTLVLLASLSSVVNASGAVESPSDVDLRAGARFLEARARLVASGWKPVRMHRDQRYEYSGTEKRLIARDFHEVDSCSTDRGSLCILYYAKNGVCLRVDTIGEQLKTMRVTRWEHACPLD